MRVEAHRWNHLFSGYRKLPNGQRLTERPQVKSTGEVVRRYGIPDVAGERNRHFLDCVVIAILIVGTLVRLEPYLYARPLWLDEAMLGLNIVQRSLKELWHPPLSHDQVAPAGYLAIERFAFLTGGRSELALRLPSLIAGIFALVVIAYLARQFLSGWPIVFAVALAAFNPSLTFFSAQVKPYAFDVMLASIVLAFGWRLLAQPSRDRQVVAGYLGAVAGLMTWFSIPLVFVVIAVAIVSRRLGFLAGWALLGIPALLHVHAYAAGNPIFASYWAMGFPSLAFGLAPLIWLFALPRRLMMSPLHWDLSSMTAASGFVVLACGIWRAWYTRWGRMLVAPILVALIAAVLHVYPFGGEGIGGGRVILYLLPSFILVAALGVSFLSDIGRALGVTAAALVVVASLVWVCAEPFGYTRSDVPRALNYLRHHWHPGDHLYVQYAAEPEVRFYAADMMHAPYATVGAPHWDLPAACCVEAADLPAGRVWALYSFRSYPTVRLWEEKEAALFRARGERQDSLLVENTALYLYDLR